jgi:hypothetical protein
MSWFTEGFLGDSNTSDKNQYTEERTRTETDRELTRRNTVDSVRDQTKQSTGSEASKQTGITKGFTDEDFAVLSDLISKLGDEDTTGSFSEGTVANADRLNALSASAAGRALNFDGNLESIIDSTRANAALDFQEGDLASIFQQVDSIGSFDNTTSQLLVDKAGRDFATRMAGVEGQIRLNAETTNNAVQSNAIQAALGGLQGGMETDKGNTQGLQNLLAALGVAKGAIQETSTEGVVDTTQTDQLNDVLAVLDQLLEKENTVTNTVRNETQNTRTTNQENPGFNSTWSSFWAF